MAVYVDDVQLPADAGNNGRTVKGRWSHLFADTSAELEDFARTLGLSPRWIQHQGQPGEHYNVTEGKRQQALKLGAHQITYREAELMFAGRREEAQRSAEQRAGRPASPTQTRRRCWLSMPAGCWPQPHRHRPRRQHQPARSPGVRATAPGAAPRNWPTAATSARRAAPSRPAARRRRGYGSTRTRLTASPATYSSCPALRRRNRRRGHDCP
jgi:hypothetical protein